jgi:hypothetical protein
MPTYTRESTVAFEHQFVDLHGDPIPPVDVTYPQVQIENPGGAIVASGIAVAMTPGTWQWSWTIPAGATLGDGWRIRWSLVDPSLSTHEAVEAFAIADQVRSPTGLDRLGAYLCVLGQSERIVWKDDSDPEYLDLTLRSRSETIGTWNKTLLVPPVPLLSYVYDQGLHVYYADTPAMTTWGDYLALWRSRPNAASAYVTETQMVHVPHDSFFFYVPYLRQLLDKLGKVTTTPLSYLDLELYQAFTRGLEFVNGQVPFTTWTWTTFPESFVTWWVFAAGIYALEARQLLEIELQHSAQALSVTLEYDHHSPLSEVIQRYTTLLQEWLPKAKLGAYRMAAGPGSVGVRPLRLSWTSRVFKIGSSNNPLGDLANLMSALGLP